MPPLENKPLIENLPSNKRKIVLLFVLLLCLILIPVSFFIYINFSKDNINQNNRNGLNSASTSKFQENTNLLEETSKRTSIINVDNFIEDSNEKINDPTINDYEKDLLLLRKAIFLNVNRAENQRERGDESVKIYKDLIDRNSGRTYASALYIKDFAIIAGSKLQLECCVNDREAFVKYSDDRYKYLAYQKDGYTIEVARLLALDNILKEVSPAREKDIAFKNTTLDLRSRLLYSYGNKLSSPDKQRILDELKSDLDQYGTYIPMTYTDLVTTKVFAPAIYAFSYDIYHQNKGLNKDINSQIDRNYEAVANTEARDFGGDLDIFSYNQSKYHSYLRYIYSINKRYGSSVDKTKSERAITETLTLINSSEELKTMSKNWFNSQEVKLGQYLATSYFISLRSKYKEIDDYMKSIGI